MLAILSNFILFLAAAASGGGGESGWSKFVHFWDTYLNYPGFEAWKFFNLIVFIIIMVKLLKRPLSEAFRTKRETIRAELIRAEEERQAALATLTTTEARLAQIESESTNIVERARLESESEKERLARETAEEIGKLRQQAASEIERAGQQVKKELRRFSAEESIRLAEERIRRDMSVEKDARLVKTNIQAIGGLN